MKEHQFGCLIAALASIAVAVWVIAFSVMIEVNHRHPPVTTEGAK